METITIPKKELKSTIKESVKEALNQELMSLRALLLPLISKREQKDIENRYGKPSHAVTKKIEIKV
ncbi:MAG: hypothetical protein AAB861_02580 [Patescibacteria group bacterium]